MTDEQLLIGFAESGSQELFGELYRRLNNRLRSFLRGRIFNSAAADDLAQETWIRVLLHAGKFHGRSRALSWICAIGKNAAVSAARKSVTKRETRVSGEVFRLKSPAVTETPVRQAISHEEYSALQAAMHGLTPKMRDVVELTDIDELDYEDAAVVLGIPVGTIRSCRHRAMQRLRQLMVAVVLLALALSSPLGGQL